MNDAQTRTDDFQVSQRRINERVDRALFGDKENGEIGIKEKVDTMYEILTQARGVGGILNGAKNGLYFLILLGGVIAFVKGWLKI